jgi:CRISPR-associated protein Cas1
VEDLGMVILQHPGIVISQAAIISCQQNNVVLVFCDKQRLPYSVILPLSRGNSLHQKILHQQVKVGRPAQKRLWQQIVQHKLEQQALTLDFCNKDSQPVSRLVRHVKSGDSGNHEAQAAQKYWKLLMGKDFRRNTDQKGVNALLNYGYAVIRAMIARAIVGSGLHPALGLFHHNQYNGLCLADDLMEPFRPWVDRIVYQLHLENSELSVDRISKERLLGLLSESVVWREKTMPLLVASHHLTANLKQAYVDRTIRLDYPRWE